MELKALQKAHAEWLRVKRPEQSRLQPAAGLVKSARNFVFPLLKYEESGEHPPGHRALLEDAIGDAVLYLMSVCTASQMVVPEPVLRCEDRPYTPLQTAAALSLMLASVYFAAAFGGTLELPVARAMNELRAAAHDFGIDFDAAVLATWEALQCR